MLGRPEFSSDGRAEIFPTPSLPAALLSVTTGLTNAVFKQYPQQLRKFNTSLFNAKTIPPIMFSLVAVVFGFGVMEMLKGRLIIPKEIVFLALSSAIMYLVSDLVLFRLYQPIRYLQYSIPLVILVLSAIVIGHLISRVSNMNVKTALWCLIACVLGLHLNVNKGVGLKDYSTQYYHHRLAAGHLSIPKDLYSSLSEVPKESVIAAHPYLADSIPTFAQRKVFINFELSHPWFDKYWEIIYERTSDFFEAYYAREFETVCRFSENHGVDYIVVDKRHFQQVYLQEGKMYFEPINSYIKTLVSNRKDFVLLSVPAEVRIFSDKNIFVVSMDSLRKKMC
jgi:hypothetical protein